MVPTPWPIIMTCQQIKDVFQCLQASGDATKHMVTKLASFYPNDIPDGPFAFVDAHQHFLLSCLKMLATLKIVIVEKKHDIDIEKFNAKKNSVHKIFLHMLQQSCALS